MGSETRRDHSADPDDGLFDLAFELFLQWCWRTGQTESDPDFDEDRWFAAARDHEARQAERVAVTQRRAA